jgi:hypothetical protein
MLDSYSTWFNMNPPSVYVGVTIHKIIWPLLTDISWLQMLVINDYTDVLPG